MDKTEKSIDKIDEQIESLLNNKKKCIKSNDKNIINYDNVSTDTKKIEKIGDLEEKDDVIVEETKKIDTVAEVPEEKKEVTVVNKKIEEDDSINPILIAVIIGLVVIMIILYAILLTRWVLVFSIFFDIICGYKGMITWLIVDVNVL